MRAALDVAGLKGLDADQTPRRPASFSDGGFRIEGSGNRGEVFYAVDEFLTESDDPVPRHRIASAMVGVIAENLITSGFTFTVRPATGAADGAGLDLEGATDPGYRYGAVLAVHAGPPTPRRDSGPIISK